MELRNSTISRDLLIHRPPIPFPAKLSFITLKKTNAGSPLLPSSIKFPLHSASSLNRPLYLSSRFRISAQIGRPTNRQNYFRKKLTQLQQVSDIWDFSKLPHENVDTNSLNLKTNTSSEKIADLDANSGVIGNAGEQSGSKLESKSTGNSVLSNNLEGGDERYKEDPELPHENVDTNSLDLKANTSSEKIADLDANSGVIGNAGEQSGSKLESKSTGDSVLSNNLEGWDERYKDPEFWGKGAEPILTVFRHYNGEVKRVVLNEDEILRRSGVNPVLYKEGFIKGLAQVNSKILFASMFAREIEKGKVVLPGNSSVVKLISSTKDPSITHNRKRLASSSSSSTADSTIAIVLLSIFFGFWVIKKLIGLLKVVLWFCVIKKLFNLWNNYRQKEILRRNKEILRRKKEILTRNIQAKMFEEDKMEGRVEIVQDSEKSDVLSVEWPPLDKEEELMENFIKDNLPAQSEDTLPVHLDDKIQEIRERARGACELEKTEIFREITDGEDDQITKVVIKGMESIQKPTLVCESSDTKIPYDYDSQGHHLLVNDLGGEIAENGSQDDI